MECRKAVLCGGIADYLKEDHCICGMQREWMSFMNLGRLHRDAKPEVDFD
jgi:hypothetical protein